MRKILMCLMIGGIMAYAGPNNYVGISDIKDALYYLIKDYKKLLNSSNLNKENISKLKKEMNLEFKEIKETIKKRNIKVDKELKDLLNKVNYIKTHAFFIKTKDDKYDKYIAEYVEENKDILKKIK